MGAIQMGQTKSGHHSGLDERLLFTSKATGLIGICDHRAPPQGYPIFVPPSFAPGQTNGEEIYTVIFLRAERREPMQSYVHMFLEHQFDLGFSSLTPSRTDVSCVHGASYTTFVLVSGVKKPGRKAMISPVPVDLHTQGCIFTTKVRHLLLPPCLIAILLLILILIPVLCARVAEYVNI
ncbi:uncharacterized protein BT62DRAFT_1013399 [Guyanagaster necrorhizus]|uniref:Uncharacterized protein n=1 Tax=Guyanagaster necrorhizus TaxID=856835 RepID=A0A9P7VGV4_9AGAR|nr:uncharacterized protein BT62DRAFT_1013399 [Guyanagaster necrorhizus MCA 3950]KAG7439856.1 hypothetical protein BT62DRAFT_1013399 [Guyanagaster necrorhizus MCA 3950]